MKNLLILTAFLLHLYSCKSTYSTDKAQINKIKTITSYLVLDQNFYKIDSVHTGRNVLKFSKTDKVLENLDFFDTQNSQGGGVIYKYDKNDKLIEEFLLDIHKEVYSSYKYEYSKDTREKYIIKEDGNKVRFQKDEFDSNNNIVKEISYSYNGDSIIGYNLIKYNSKHLMTERQVYNENRLRGINLVSYDSSGLELEFQLIDKKSNTTQLTKFIYEGFDKNKNWLLRKRFVDGVPHSIDFQKVELQ